MLQLTTVQVFQNCSKDNFCKETEGNLSKEDQHTISYHYYNHWNLKRKSTPKQKGGNYSVFISSFNLPRSECSDDPEKVYPLWPRPESRVDWSVDIRSPCLCFLFFALDCSPTSDKELLCLLLCVEAGCPLDECEFLSLELWLGVPEWLEEFINEDPADIWYSRFDFFSASCFSSSLGSW